MLKIRKIRINGILIRSPGFQRKADADKWYEEMKRRKQMGRYGISHVGEGTKFIDYSRVWLNRRMKSYPMSTWQSDEQRLRTYVLPVFGSMPIAAISRQTIRNFLLEIQDQFKIDMNTVIRVKALMSKIIGDALNEDPPLVQANPVVGLKLGGRRLGRKKPETIESRDEVIRHIKCAQETGRNEYLADCILLGTGCRKSECIALQWGDINFETNVIHFQRHLEQASNTIKPGTKAGKHETRLVPIAAGLGRLLLTELEKSKYQEKDSFVLTNKDGSYVSARAFHDLFVRISKKFEKSYSPHKLRHTFGRLFIERAGNQKALQVLLGHSSSLTTDIYSELTSKQVMGFSETMSFDTTRRNSSEAILRQHKEVKRGKARK